MQNALLIFVVGMALVIALVVLLDRRERRGKPTVSQLAWQEFVNWATNTPEWQLPPILVRVYDGSQFGAENYQKEASVLATRAYRPTSTSAMSQGGPGALDIAAFGLLAFGQGRGRSLTVTYTRQ